MKNNTNMERRIITISETEVVAMPTVPVWMTQQEMADLFMVFAMTSARLSVIFIRIMNCWKKQPCATSDRKTGHVTRYTALKWS